MNNLSWRLGLAAMCAVLTMFGRATPVYAAEEDRSGPADRLDRLERSLNELAQRQEQLMRQFSAAQERQGPMMAPGRENFRPPMAGSGRPGIGQPMPSMGGPPEIGFPAPGAPPASPARGGKDLGGLVALFLLVVLAFNILVAVWINSDIRKRAKARVSSLPSRCWPASRLRSSMHSCAWAIRGHNPDVGGRPLAALTGVANPCPGD